MTTKAISDKIVSERERSEKCSRDFAIGYSLKEWRGVTVLLSLLINGFTKIVKKSIDTDLKV